MKDKVGSQENWNDWAECKAKRNIRINCFFKQITILQDIINRMCRNSMFIKVCNIITFSLLLSFMSFSNIFSSYWILISMLISTSCFALLDSYYLGLERFFISKNRQLLRDASFILNNPHTSVFDILNIGMLNCDSPSELVWENLNSISILPFYLLFLIIAFILIAPLPT